MRDLTNSTPRRRCGPPPIPTSQAPEALAPPPAGAGASADPVAAVAATATALVVARASGVVHRYALPSLTLVAQHLLRCRPHRIAINCDATRLGVVDFGGAFSLLDMRGGAGGGAGDGADGAAGADDHAAASGPHAGTLTTAGSAGKGARGGPPITGRHVPLGRRDVWDAMWASDDPGRVALMERGRLYVLAGGGAGAPEEPAASAGHLAAFEALEVTAVDLDAVLARPDAPRLGAVVGHEARSLRWVGLCVWCGF